MLYNAVSFLSLEMFTHRRDDFWQGCFERNFLVWFRILTRWHIRWLLTSKSYVWWEFILAFLIKYTFHNYQYSKNLYYLNAKYIIVWSFIYLIWIDDIAHILSKIVWKAIHCLTSNIALWESVLQSKNFTLKETFEITGLETYGNYNSWRDKDNKRNLLFFFYWKSIYWFSLC